MARRAPVLGIEVRLVGDVEQEAEHDADRDEAREREGRVADPARIQARELDLGLLRGGRRGRAGGGGGRGRGGAGVRGGAAAPRAGAAASRRGEAVEPHAAALLAVRAPGADLDAGEPEQPVHRARGDVDRADAVARDGAHAAPEQARADLDAVLGDAVARREPAREGETERDDERDGDPDEALAAAVAGHEGREQRRERARDLLDRMDEQHAAIEPPPGAAIGRRHVRVAPRRLGRASSARRPGARRSRDRAPRSTAARRPTRSSPSRRPGRRAARAGRARCRRSGCARSARCATPGAASRRACRPPAARPPSGARCSATAA